MSRGILLVRTRNRNSRSTWIYGHYKWFMLLNGHNSSRKGSKDHQTQTLYWYQFKIPDVSFEGSRICKLQSNVSCNGENEMDHNKQTTEKKKEIARIRSYSLRLWKYFNLIKVVKKARRSRSLVYDFPLVGSHSFSVIKLPLICLALLESFIFYYMKQAKDTMGRLDVLNKPRNQLILYHNIIIC